MFRLFDDPVLLLVLGAQLLLALLALAVLYWVVRLAVRHGVTDASRRTGQPPFSPPPPAAGDGGGGVSPR